jgi:hypothetical protein
MLVPGLLQTEDYARAIFRARLGMTADEIDEKVAARLKRQGVLDQESAPALWVIVDEAVVRRPVGGRGVMSEQVNHLVEAAHLPQVSIQVISSAVGAHRGLSAGAFVVADFVDAPAVGYQEAACQGQFVDRREDVEILVECWDTLVREALPWAASQALLEEAAKSWT